MKKLPFFLKFYSSLLFLSVIVYSCCSEPTEVTIVGSSDLRFTFQTRDGGGSIDTIEGLSFIVTVPLDREFVSHSIENALVNSAYGWSCEEELQNSLVASSFAISCDQDITYDGAVISAGSNFADNPDLTSSVFPDEAFIIFNTSFMDKTTFQEGTHTFTVELKTDDDLDIISSGDVYIKS